MTWKSEIRCDFGIMKWLQSLEIPKSHSSSSDQKQSIIINPSMESINNTFKGGYYGKVYDQENQFPHHSPLPKPSSSSRKTLNAIISVISLFFFLVIVAITIVGLFSPFDESESELNPESILELSLRVTVKDVSSISMSFQSINDMPKDAAVGECVRIYTNALSQLTKTITEIEREKKKGGNWLTKEVVGDIKTWISAAMTDAETCSDGIKEMGTVVGNKIKKEMKMANQMMSISLAIVNQIKKLLMIKLH